MEQHRKLELIDLAIQKLIHNNSDNNNDNSNNHNLKDHEAEYQHALSHLLSVSQLEMSKRDETVNQSEASSPSEPVASAIEKTESETVDGGGGCRGSENDDEIIKELKKVKKQNFVTHCLLSVMIVLTVAWQLSEVSLVLKVKDGINHPFRSFGNMLKEIVKVSDINGQDADDKENNESPSLPSLKIPDMTINMDVPNSGKE
ncbi:uncharacterized protein [Cicer arietinum]|uniref:Uncharacterized protein LOC101503749 isoform X2 n=1 Tax=Cicer arietinum TaxID=3827 RepID=A0A1S2YB85_CICAR|nr:uncharacterized protein LOC101503749 isoform X2 [Cicer arietinum]